MYGRLDLSYITIWCIITLVYRRRAEKINKYIYKPRKEMKIFSHVLAFQENKETYFRRKGGRPIGNGKSAGTEVEKAVQGSTEPLILCGRTACVN